MNNQKNKNETIDLSQLPIREKEPTFQPKRFNLENLKRSWQRIGKKNQIFTIIIVGTLIFIIIILISLFGRTGGGKIGPTPSEYTPPAEYPAGEEYTPPFP
jgi:hypothetical protein